MNMMCLFGSKDEESKLLSSYSTFAGGSSASSASSETAAATTTGKTWEYLQQTEKHRRAILKQVELPFGQILFRKWKGSCFKALATDRLLYASMGIFLVIRCYARQSILENPPSIVAMLRDEGNIGILGGFLSFVLVIFVNQTNARFFDMYQKSKSAAGRIQDVTGYCAAAVARGQVTAAWAHRLVRTLNAAHVVGYVGLKGPYQQDNFFDELNRQYGLLTDPEIHQRMVHGTRMDAGSAAFKELITWCQLQVGQAQQQPQQLSVYEVTELQRRILQIRADVDGIYDYRDQPSPYFYIHFICLLSALYLPLFAVDSAFEAGWVHDNLAWSKELLAAIMVLVQAIFVVGLRLLGQKMTDPYGDDWEDLSVITYVTTTIENCRIILESSQRYHMYHNTNSDQDDDAVEEELMKRKLKNPHHKRLLSCTL